MPYYQITEKGAEKYVDFWCSPRTKRTWPYTLDDWVESALLEKLWESPDPIWLGQLREEGRILRLLEKKGLVTRVERV